MEKRLALEEHTTLNINEFLEELGKNIWKIRKTRGLSQEALAERVSEHCNPQTISKYERGEMNMGLKRLLEICAALETDLNSLVPNWPFGGSLVPGLWQIVGQLDSEHQAIITRIAEAVLMEQNDRQKGVV